MARKGLEARVSKRISENNSDLTVSIKKPSQMPFKKKIALGL